MKKQWNLLAAVLSCAALLGGCGKTGSDLASLDTGRYVQPGTYRGLTVTVPKTDVTQEEVEDALLGLCAQNFAGETTPVTDRGVQRWDTVNIDYEGKRDGVAFEGGTASGFDLLIGSGQFIDGFEDGLIGARTGETRDLTLRFPDPYPSSPDLAGVEVVFTVTVNGIGAPPELTDERAAQLDASCGTAQELEQRVLEQMTQQAQDDYDARLDNALVEQMMEGASFLQEPPEEMVEEYLARIRSSLQQAAGYYGMSLNDLVLAQYGIPESELEEAARPDAAESARESILMQAIANAEGLNPTEEELQQSLQEEAERLGFASAKEFQEEGITSMALYRDALMVQNVLDFVREQAVVTETEEDPAE